MFKVCAEYRTDVWNHVLCHLDRCQALSASPQVRDQKVSPVVISLSIANASLKQKVHSAVLMYIR